MSRFLSIIHIDNIKGRIAALALIVLYAYFAFHAFSGSQGLMRWMDYAKRKDNLDAKLTGLTGQHEDLQAKVDALSGDGLDLDVLDMKAREILYVSDTKELTIWLDPNQ